VSPLRELILVLSLGAIGTSLILFAWAWRKWTAPASKTFIDEGSVAWTPEDDELPPLRTEAERAEVDERKEWVAEMRGNMTVTDDLASPLDLDVVVTLDRIQDEAVPAFTSAIDRALAGFSTPPVPPHEETNTEFVQRAELAAWSKQLSGSFKTISLSSDTQEITREQLAKAMGGGR
jgi:hypothetical protein